MGVVNMCDVLLQGVCVFVYIFFFAQSGVGVWIMTLGCFLCELGVEMSIRVRVFLLLFVVEGAEVWMWLTFCGGH